MELGAGLLDAAQGSDQHRMSVVDLYSGAGGMSFGFHRHPLFQLVAAVDVELGKPSDGHGAIECNKTYEANIGIRPHSADLGELPPQELADWVSAGTGGKRLDVLLACPPCTGFSRAQAKNHIVDDPRNGLVPRTALFARELLPSVIVMENARELITGRFASHFQSLKQSLELLGYNVRGEVYRLTRFGLPQVRERAIVVAARRDLQVRTLADLWSGYAVRSEALTVRSAISQLPPVTAGVSNSTDPMHVSTKLGDGTSSDRIAAMPHDGGSWADLLRSPETSRYLIPSMWTAVKQGRMNSYCDIYGRMAWDRPAPTIKRECCHPGNGRYLHPEQDRLCTIREMALLQGFPADYKFAARSRKNMYRHIGDAVPPLVSYQLAHVAAWMITGCRPNISDLALGGAHLRSENIIAEHEALPLFAAE